VTALSDIEVRRIIAFKPRGSAMTRVHTLVMVLLGTGLRIEEALSLPVLGSTLSVDASP
jgi:integrase